MLLGSRHVSHVHGMKSTPLFMPCLHSLVSNYSGWSPDVPRKRTARDASSSYTANWLGICELFSGSGAWAAEDRLEKDEKQQRLQPTSHSTHLRALSELRLLQQACVRWNASTAANLQAGQRLKLIPIRESGRPVGVISKSLPPALPASGCTCSLTAPP